MILYNPKTVNTFFVILLDSIGSTEKPKRPQKALQHYPKKLSESVISKDNIRDATFHRKSGTY